VAIKKSPQEAEKANVVLSLKPSVLPSERNHSSHHQQHSSGAPGPHRKSFVIRYMQVAQNGKNAVEKTRNKVKPVLNMH
jgi:hypothetical protein